MAKKTQKTVRKYAWKDGRGLKVSAQAVGEELERIETRGNGVTPEAVVDAARPVESLLHPFFTWDDGLAAELYRQQQAAGEIIRPLRVIVCREEDGKPQKQIAFVSVRVVDESDAPTHRYVTTARAMTDTVMRQQVLDDAMIQLRGWRNRYGHLEELAGVVRIIDEQLDPAIAGQ